MIDLVNPPTELEKLKHKKKRLVQSPNSFFMRLGGRLTFGQSGEAEVVSARGEEVEAKDSSVVREKLNCSFNAEGFKKGETVFWFKLKKCAAPEHSTGHLEEDMGVHQAKGLQPLLLFL